MAPRNDEPTPRRPRIQSGQGAEVRFRDGDVVNFASSDYLSYSGDPRLVAAATQAARRYGVGAGASPIDSGLLPPLFALERDLAAWEGVEAALVFADDCPRDLALGVLAGDHDVVYFDAANRPGLTDGFLLAQAHPQPFRHGDLTHLDELMSGHKAGRKFVVSESLFSRDGDLADPSGLLDVARRHDALLVLDESHATGVLGEHGRGLSDLVSPEERLLKLGSLSHALGTHGGYIAGSRTLIDRLVRHARPYRASTALAPPIAAAARRAIFLTGEEPDRRRQVLEVAAALREGLAKIGLEPGQSSSQIVTFGLENAPRFARRWSGRFLVTPGSSRQSIRLTSGHTVEDVGDFLEALRGEKESPG